MSITPDLTATTEPVTVANFPATQVVSATALTSIDVKTPALGQTTMAVSIPVAIASNQSAIPVTGTVAANATLTAETTKIIGTVNIATAQTLATVTTVGTVSAVTAITNALPTGANTIGAVNIAAAQTLATITTVGAVTAITNALPAGANTIGAVNIAAAQTLANITTLGTITNALPAGVNTIGAVAGIDGLKATYSAASFSVVPATLATDIMTITGSATKTIRINRVVFTATQSASGQVAVVYLRRSTANTAGTSTAIAAISHDANNAAATATVLAYTANPTVGTLVGNLRVKKIFVGAANSTSDERISDFGIRNSQAIVLRGINQVFAVNLAGVTVTGGNFSISIEWTEE